MILTRNLMVAKYPLILPSTDRVIGILILVYIQLTFEKLFVSLFLLVKYFFYTSRLKIPAWTAGKVLWWNKDDSVNLLLMAGLMVQ